jgi:PAS domain S-box-containing protein
MSIDRSLVFWFSPDHDQLDCIHEWHADGVTSAIGRLRRQPTRKYPWLCDQLVRGQPVVISKLDDLPPEAAAERETYDANKTRSLVYVPMRVRERSLGALCFDSVRTDRQWSQQLVVRLTLLGDMIGNALERVRAERALAESRQLIQAITEATPYIVFLFDLAEQSVKYANRQVKHFLGYEPEYVQTMGGDAVGRLMHPEDVEDYHTSIVGWRNASDDDLIESEFRLQRSDGCWRSFSFCGRVFMRDPAGQVRKMIVIAQDITERKQAEEELLKGATGRPLTLAMPASCG